MAGLNIQNLIINLFVNVVGLAICTGQDVKILMLFIGDLGVR